MLAIPLALTIVATLASAAWLSRHFQLRRAQQQFILEPGCPGPPEDTPRISVVVAAKDEAENIGTCVRTMLAQDYGNFELIVCNDRSSDDTREIVERIAAEDSRVRLLNIDSLPEGWCGKNHAMQRGIAESSGEWICMIDADCRQTSNRTLSTAMQHAVDNGIDLLSVLPTLEMRGFWQTAAQPVCTGLFMLWFSPVDVNDPDKPQAYANGAFMLMRRATYEAIGTHEAVRDRISEDMSIATLVKHSGHNLKVVNSSGLYQVRMYSTVRGLICGWSRIFFGTFGTSFRLVISLLMLMLGIVPCVAAPLGLALAVTGGPHAPWWLACGVVGAIGSVIQFSVLARFRRVCNSNPWTVWMYPIGNLVASYAVLVALTRHLPGAKVVWKGTEYSRP